MNKIQLWMVRRWLYKKANGGDKMFQLILYVLAWASKNLAIIIGILEAVVKAITAIVTLTPTKRDDKVLPIVDNVFSSIKKVLYTISDIMAGKEFNIYK